MGQTLSAPVTDKKSESRGNDRFLFAVSEMQGWRISMEDAHAAVLDLDESNGIAFFGVYDGHGGQAVARFSGENLHKHLVSTQEYEQGLYGQALRRSFLSTDESLWKNSQYTNDPSGCTAVTALFANETIYVANAGDSRSVLSVNGEAKALSDDHKPSNDGERKRIINAGGYIEFGRVNGNLALSRAIGDLQFKKNTLLSPEKQVISAEPDIQERVIHDDDEFLVLACDGIWDCLSSQQVIDIIRLKVAEGLELVDICEAICDLCLAPRHHTLDLGIGCDNMTILIIAILGGRTKKEWYDWVTDRVKNPGNGYRTPDTLPELYIKSRQGTDPRDTNEVTFPFSIINSRALIGGNNDISGQHLVSKETLQSSLDGEGTPT